jgi:hypothetical protein
LARLIDAILELPTVWQLLGVYIVIAISKALCANSQSSYGDQVLAYYQKIQANAPITTVVAITGLSGLEATAYADLAEAIRKPARVNQSGDSGGGGGGCGGCSGCGGCGGG